MASINNYPAHTPEQTFTCEAIAEVIGRTQGLPYLITIFSNYTDVRQTSNGNLTVSIQTKYPPFVSQSTAGNPAISFYGDGYDNFRLHTSWKLNDTDEDSLIVPYCYLDPVTIFARQLYESGASSIGTGIFQGGASGSGLTYALEPIEDFPHVVNDTTIGQTVVEKYGGYNYAVVRGNLLGRVLSRSSAWSQPTQNDDLSQKRVVTHVQPIEGDPTRFYYSTTIVTLDYRIIYGESFQSGAEWLAWCKAH